MNRRAAIRFVWLTILISFAARSLGQQPDCGKVLGVSERISHTPPNGPEHYVDIHHDKVLRMRLTFRGHVEEFPVFDHMNPVSKKIDKMCLLESETLEIEVKKACPDPWVKTTVTIAPAPPQLSLSAVHSPPGGEGNVVINWRAINAFPYHLLAVAEPDSIVVRKLTNWEGTMAEGVLKIPVMADWQSMHIELTGCNAIREADVDLTQFKCDKPCEDKCEEMPHCVADPVNTFHGNMRYEEIDPLPSNGFLPFRRTYLSRYLFTVCLNEEYPTGGSVGWARTKKTRTERSRSWSGSSLIANERSGNSSDESNASSERTRHSAVRRSVRRHRSVGAS